MDIIDEIYPKRKENPKLICGKFIWFTERCAHNIKHFILRNKFFIDIFFILIYLLEQAGFIYLVYTEKFTFKTTSAFFILILLSTMAIERVLMELRYTTLKKELKKETHEFTNYNLDLIDISKYLNRIKEILEHKKSK